MKSLPYLWVVLVIAVASVNCRGYSTTGEELQGSGSTAAPELYYSEDTSVADDESTSVLYKPARDIGNIQERSQINPTWCRSVGIAACSDNTIKKMCVDLCNLKQGCPLDKGFFGFLDTSQCFKLMTDHKNLNWTQGKALCEEQKPKLKLAHPYNPISVRKYIVERYGAKQAYVDAKANGKTFIWQDNDEVIDNNSPLWIAQRPALGKCLILQYTNLATQPNQPYWPTDCKTANDSRFPLCELVLE